MKLILTSSLGGAVKLNGKRLPCGFPTENKLPDTLRACWKSPSRVILIAASPDFYEKNDDLAACFRQSFPLNGLPISALELCDARNPELAAQISDPECLLSPAAAATAAAGIFWPCDCLECRVHELRGNCLCRPGISR